MPPQRNTADGFTSYIDFFDAFPPSFGFTSIRWSCSIFAADPCIIEATGLRCKPHADLWCCKLLGWHPFCLLCGDSKDGILRDNIKKKRNDVLDCVVACAHCFGRLSFVAEGWLNHLNNWGDAFTVAHGRCHNGLRRGHLLRKKRALHQRINITEEPGVRQDRTNTLACQVTLTLSADLQQDCRVCVTSNTDNLYTSPRT